MRTSATARLTSQAAPRLRSVASTGCRTPRRPDGQGERLGPGGQGDGVGPRHPGLVGRRPRRAGSPRSRARCRRPGPSRRPAGTGTPARRCRAGGRRTPSSTAPESATARPSATTTLPVARCQRGRRRRSRDENWKAPSTAYGTAQVMCTTTGSGRRRHPGVGGQQQRAAGQLDQPERPGDGRDHDEGDERERHPPGRPCRPGGACVGVRTVTGRRPGRAARRRWSRARRAAERCSRHSDQPRPIIAMPLGTANRRWLTIGSRRGAMVATAATASRADAQRARTPARYRAMPNTQAAERCIRRPTTHVERRRTGRGRRSSCCWWPRRPRR